MRAVIMRLTIAAAATSLMSACAAPELQTFEVTFKTLRDCRPAGILGELCADRSSFENKSRTARVTVEQRGPSDFILHEESGRSLPGYIDRGHYFAAARWEETHVDGCARKFERTVKFEIVKDLSIPTPQRAREPDRIVGNVQDRSSQNLACGQENGSRFEESFSGNQVDPEPTGTGLPALPTPGGEG